MDFLTHGGPLGLAARAMQGREDWPCDFDPGVVTEAGNMLKHLGENGLARLARSGDPDLLAGLTYLGAPRFVLVLRSLAAAMPESENPLAEIFQKLRPKTPGEVPQYNACINRLLHLERVEVLQLVYNGPRLKEIAQLLKETNP